MKNLKNNISMSIIIDGAENVLIVDFTTMEIIRPMKGRLFGESIGSMKLNSHYLKNEAIPGMTKSYEEQYKVDPKNNVKLEQIFYICAKHEKGMKPFSVITINQLADLNFKPEKFEDVVGIAIPKWILKDAKGKILEEKFSEKGVILRIQGSLTIGGVAFWQSNCHDTILFVFKDVNPSYKPNYVRQKIIDSAGHFKQER